MTLLGPRAEVQEVGTDFLRMLGADRRFGGLNKYGRNIFEKSSRPTQLLLLLVMSRSSRLLLRLAVADLVVAWVTLARGRGADLPFLAARGFESSKLWVLGGGSAVRGQARPTWTNQLGTWVCTS